MVIGAGLLTICFILQLIGSIRYITRMHEDLIGIGLYLTTLVFFGVAAFGFFIIWQKTKHNES